MFTVDDIDAWSGSRAQLLAVSMNLTPRDYHSPAPDTERLTATMCRALSSEPVAYRLGRLEPIPASGAGERNVGGFVIWKNGRTAVFRHPDQVFF